MEDPKVTYLEDEYHFLYDVLGVELIIERFREQRDELYADVQPRNANGTGTLPPDKLNLGSSRSIKMYANTLGGHGLLDGDDWFGLLTKSCELARTRYRAGEPATWLHETQWRTGQRYVLRPFIDQHGTTILFGDGGVSKSVHALAMAISIATRHALFPGADPPDVTGPVLYLDWEADAETHAERMEAICSGAGIPIPTNVLYMRRSASISESVREIRREIALKGVVAAFVDSIGAACGADPEKAEGIIRAMNAMRAFDVPVFALHHITKDAKDKTKPFGSVYAHNLARMTWRIDKEQAEGSDAVAVRLINFKANFGRLEPSTGHRVRFVNDAAWRLEQIRFEAAASYDLPQRQSTEGGVKNAIVKALASGAHTVQELALEISAKDDTVLKALRRDPDGWFFQLPDGRWGRKDIGHGQDSVRSDMSSDSRTDTGVPYKGAGVLLSDQSDESGQEEGSLF